MSVIDSADVFVARTHSSPHNLFELCEDLLLDLELLEHRFEHEVAVGEAFVVGAAGDERREETGLALVVAAPGDLAVDFRPDVRERFVDDLLLHVSDHDR